eukprot:scaffold3878_cov363-Prasinococcus_capsulatus_cf.AAC.7
MRRAIPPRLRPLLQSIGASSTPRTLHACVRKRRRARLHAFLALPHALAKRRVLGVSVTHASVAAACPRELSQRLGTQEPASKQVAGLAMLRGTCWPVHGARLRGVRAVTPLRDWKRSARLLHLASLGQRREAGP